MMETRKIHVAGKYIKGGRGRRGNGRLKNTVEEQSNSEKRFSHVGLISDRERKSRKRNQVFPRP